MSAESDAHQRFAELYSSLAAPILAYAARRTASPQDAADVMAEAFAIAWRRIDDVPAGDEARPWLYGVARGVLANHHRGVRRQRRLSERVATVLAQAVQASAATREGVDGRAGTRTRGPLGDTFGDPTVLAALEALSEADRELLMLVAWEDLTRAEIAQVLGCSPATLRVRLHRAGSRFRAAYAAHQEGSHTPRNREPLAGPAVSTGLRRRADQTSTLGAPRR